MNYYKAAENIEKLQKLTVKDLEGYKELDQVYGNKSCRRL